MTNYRKNDEEKLVACPNPDTLKDMTPDEKRNLPENCINSSYNRTDYNFVAVVNAFFDKKSEDMNPREFLDYYIDYFNNYYSKRFRNLNLENSIVEKLDSELPKIDSKLNRLEMEKLFQDIVRKTGGTETWIIYLIIAKESRLCRVGKTQNAFIDRWNEYRRDAKFKINSQKRKANNFELALYKRNYKLDEFEVYILDVQNGDEHAKYSEEFLTIYFNRDSSDSKGYNLEKNNKYNLIVGSLADCMKLQGELNPMYKRIDYYDLVDHMKAGYEREDVAVIFGVSPKVIDYRIRAWFGEDETYLNVKCELIKPIFLKNITIGMTKREIAKKFVKIDFPNKQRAWNKIEDGIKTYKKDIKTTTYKKGWVEYNCHKMFGLSWIKAYERYCLKPILIECFQAGLWPDRIANILNILRLYNYKNNAKGDDWNSASMQVLTKRIWHKKTSQVRDDLMEPVVCELISDGLSGQKTVDRLGQLALQGLVPILLERKVSTNTIAKKLKVDVQVLKDFLKRRLGFSTLTDAKKFAKNNILRSNRTYYYENHDYLN